MMVFIFYCSLNIECYFQMEWLFENTLQSPWIETVVLAVALSIYEKKDMAISPFLYSLIAPLIHRSS